MIIFGNTSIAQTFVFDGGNVGIGTSTPGTKLHLISTDPQVRLGYNTDNYANLNIGSDGALTVTTTNVSTTTISNNLRIGTSDSTHGLGQAGDLFISENLEVDSDMYVDADIYLGDATTTDVTYFNSRIGTHLVPTVDNVSDLGDETNWLRWRTGLFGTSIGIAGTATTTGTSLSFNGVGDITAGLASTWQTTSGLLTITGTGGLALNAVGQAMELNSATFDLNNTGAITIGTDGDEQHITFETNNFDINSIGTVTIDGTDFIYTSTGTYTVNSTGAVNIDSDAFTTLAGAGINITSDGSNAITVTYAGTGGTFELTDGTTRMSVADDGSIVFGNDGATTYIDGSVITLSGDTVTTGTITSNLTDDTADAFRHSTRHR